SVRDRVEVANGASSERLDAGGMPPEWLTVNINPAIMCSERDPTHSTQGGKHLSSATMARTALRPLEDRLVVRPLEAEERTASGIVIPDTAKEKPQQGEVLAVGPGRRSEHTGELIPLDVKEGDRVVYSRYGGTEITLDGEELLILSSRDVLAVMGGDS